MTRTQRRTKSVAAPYGYNKQGKVRVVPRGTGAKKVFGLINIPLAIYNAVEKGKVAKAATAQNKAVTAKLQQNQAPPHASMGVD